MPMTSINKGILSNIEQLDIIKAFQVHKHKEGFYYITLKTPLTRPNIDTWLGSNIIGW